MLLRKENETTRIQFDGIDHTVLAQTLVLTACAFGTTVDRLKTDLLSHPNIWSSPVAATMKLLFVEYSGRTNHVRDEYIRPADFTKKCKNFLAGLQQYPIMAIVAERGIAEIKAMRAEGHQLGPTLQDISDQQLTVLADRLRERKEMAPAHVTSTGEFRQALKFKIDLVNTDIARKQLGWQEDKQSDGDRDRQFAAIFMVLGMTPTVYESAAPIVRSTLIRHLSTTRMGAVMQYDNIRLRVARRRLEIESWINRLTADPAMYEATLSELDAAIPE